MFIITTINLKSYKMCLKNLVIFKSIKSSHHCLTTARYNYWNQLTDTSLIRFSIYI